MASFVATNGHPYPVAAVVQAWQDLGFTPSDSEPPGTPVASGTVSGAGALTVAGLTEGVSYWLVGQDAQSRWRWMRAYVPRDLEPPIDPYSTLEDHEGRLDAEEAASAALDARLDVEEAATVAHDTRLDLVESTQVSLGSGSVGGVKSAADPAYGAVGDGSTDDHDAIEAALTAADGAVWLPPGIFNVGFNGLLIPSDTALEGIGVDAAVLKKHADVAHSLVLLTDSNDAAVRRVTIDGQYPTFTEVGHGISDGAATGTLRATLEDLIVKNWPSYGIGFQSVAAFYEDVLLRRVRVENTGADGIDIKNNAALNNGFVFDTIVVERFGRATTGNVKAGIDVRGPAQLAKIVIREFGDGGTDGLIGVRFRHDPDLTSEGGDESTLVGFWIDSESTRATGTCAVQIVAQERVNVSGGTAKDCDTGVQINVSTVTADRHTVSGVDAYSCNRGFDVLDAADNCEFVADSAHDCATGFRIGGDRTALIRPATDGCTLGIDVLGTANGTVIVAPGFEGNTTDIIIRAGATDTRIEGLPAGAVVTDLGTRTRINGLGMESANAESPTAASWEVGDIVEFTDTGDASGDGVYVLKHDGTTWTKLG